MHVCAAPGRAVVYIDDPDGLQFELIYHWDNFDTSIDPDGAHRSIDAWYESGQRWADWPRRCGVLQRKKSMRAIVVNKNRRPRCAASYGYARAGRRAGRIACGCDGGGRELFRRHTRRGTHHVRLGGSPMVYPVVPGEEGVGHVRALGNGVTGFGDRRPRRVASPARQLCRGGKAIRGADGQGARGVSDHDSLVYAQGLTAHYLTRSAYAAGAGTTALVHAAAGVSAG